MPVNRTFKSSPKHNGVRRFRPRIVEGRLKDDLGIRLILIERTARPDKVARGKMLAARPDYPPPHVVNAIAELIADHVQI